MVSLQGVNRLLLLGNMCGLTDQRDERAEFVWSAVEQVVGVFKPLKIDEVGQSFNLGRDGFVYNEAGYYLLRFLLRQMSNYFFTI